MNACPSELQLERLLANVALEPVSLHVAGCARCQGRVDAMRAVDTEFRAQVYPRTREAVVERATRSGPRRWLPRLLWLAPALTVAMALALILPQLPPGDYVGVKGGVAFSAFSVGPTGVVAISDGEHVPANATLRFRVRVSAPCHLWVVSIDGQGQVSRLFPSAGEGGASVSQTLDVPGGAVLDGEGGPERLFAICSPGALSFAEVEAQLERAFAAGGATGVRERRSVPRWKAVAQESLLLEKTR